MSTLKVTNIESPSGGGVNAKIADVNGGQLSNRNLIINGEHNVNQRDLGTFTPANGNFATDRWKCELSDASKYTAGQSSTAPDGYRKSLKITSSSAFTPAADDYFLVTQDIEGFTSAPTAIGSSAAKSITLSFWVRSSLTGTFACAIRNSGFDRSHIKEYTISTADTWEHKTVTFPGITDGTWNTGSTVGIRVNWSLGAGSDFHGAANTTLNTNDFATSSSTNVVATNGATWFLTGVQLEVGEVATAFEHRSYGDELVRCQRYYVELSGGNDAFTYSGKGQGSDSVDVTIPLCVPLRASPTMNAIDSRAFTDSSSFAASSSTTPTVIQFSANNPHLAINCGGFSGLTNNEVSVWGPKSNALEISAEL